MESKTKKQQKPKWFQGQIYTEGAEVRNPFSGETYELNGLELSLYDFIIGCQMVFDAQSINGCNINCGAATDKRISEFQKALNWFRVNNPEAYYVLLD